MLFQICFINVTLLGCSAMEASLPMFKCKCVQSFMTGLEKVPSIYEWALKSSLTFSVQYFVNGLCVQQFMNRLSKLLLFLETNV